MRLPVFLRINPVTRKRWQRFRRIRVGYYALILFLVVTILSFFAEFLANHRPIVLSHEGKLYFPTFRFIPMSTFGQQDDWGFDDVETDYRRLKKEWEGTKNWVLMPPIPFNPLENDFDFYQKPPPHPPDDRHFLGTDSQARDVAARLLYGYRLAILFSLALVLMGQVIGVIVGTLQGYLGGRFDLLSQRGIEIWSTLPFLYVVILLSTFIQANFWSLLAIMALFQWMGITYYMRTEMYREKARDYCLAARSIGASNWRIMFTHLLPNSLTPLVTLTPFAVVGGISALTALDFLGFGLPAPTPSWGELLDQALQPANRSYLWLVLSPFAAISITLIVVTLIGESIREAFDPRDDIRYH